ncbi:MAG TPA: SMP-30/gluconolactonase/LRE family protein [Lunatimonas sp.]|nr:SMP-30/gluconolactonase/LRE family protein [Lunatimonas sp.]
MGKILNYTYVSLFMAFAGCGPSAERQVEGEKTKTLPLEIERNHELMDILFPEGTEAEILGSGFEWTEGPLWVDSENMLLFSEIPTNTVHRWTEAEGVSVYLKPSGYTGDTGRGGEVGSNGLLLDPNGKLVLCQHGDRQMGKMNASLNSPTPEYETIVGEYNGMRFNSPNDAVYDSQGNLYFTDPPYGLEFNIDDPAKEIDFQGVYRFDSEGVLTLLLDSLTRPNGLAFLPAEQTLIIANSDPQKPHWYSYRLVDQGKSLSDGKLFYDSSDALTKDKGLPDGLKVSKEGIIFATGPGGVWVFDALGMVIGRLKVGELTSNVALDADEKFLYVTADSYVIRIPISEG